jgi:putative membrane protein
MLFRTLLPCAIGLQHIYILTLEMFLWRRPLGMRTFNQTPSSAAATASLAQNMGLYNGFLAAAVLGTTLYAPYREMGAQVWPLACVAVAGAFGGVTVGRRIWWVQGVPAVLALLGVLYT